MPRKLLAALAACSLVSLITPFLASASEADCRFEPKISELAEARGTPALDFFEGIRQELRIRKELLTQVITCSKNETEDLRLKLTALPESNPEVRTLRTLLLERTNDALRFYDQQLKKVDDLGLQGTKDTARAIAAWRRYSWTPLAENGLNLLIWAKNEDLVRAAHTRLSLIGQTVRTLKLLEQEEIKTLYGSAEKNVSESQKFHEEARNFIRDLGAAQDSSIAIKNTLESLARAYKNFFDLSESVNQIVRHK